MFVSPDQSRPIASPPSFRELAALAPAAVFVFVEQERLRLAWGGALYADGIPERVDATYLLVAAAGSTELTQAVRTTFKPDGVPLPVELVGHLLGIRPWLPDEDLEKRIQMNFESRGRLVPEPTEVMVEGRKESGLQLSAYDMYAIGVDVGDRYLTAAVPVAILPHLRFEFESCAPAIT